MYQINISKCIKNILFMNKVEKFYNTIGWESINGNTEDSIRWEDLRYCAKDYVSNCRKRINRFIPHSGEFILDMASGPIQYPEYLEYHKNFKKRHCVDLSQDALDQAKLKIGEKGEYFCGSFFDLSFEKNYYDCCLSLHTIYHIDKELQENAVRKLLEIAKPDAPVIIIYSNPYNLIYRLVRLRNKIFRKALPLVNIDSDNFDLYFYTFPNSWWKRFEDIAFVEILTWRFLKVEHSSRIIPNNYLGKVLFSLIYFLEELFPRLLAKHADFPMIILKKK
jgi:2-polyprenyl-3-methyl-5-hydroxy-6-metoxy-1,4-benzoquinol methylase